MNRTLTWLIEPAQEGLILEKFLRTHGCSHHVLTHLKRTECGILVNGTWAYTNQVLHTGDQVTIRMIETESSPNIVPTNLPLDIVFEDEDLMVINKPANTPIHPSINNYTNTLANGVMGYFNSQNIPFVFRCINRLDRDTSGLLILAKNMFSGAVLSQMSSRREIHRTYQTIVSGVIAEHGTIDAPIARAEDSAIMRCVDFDKGDSAITHFHRLSHNASYSLAEVILETGRTHQIRVHMKYIGHPLIGDFLYYPESITVMKRQALHSSSLRFLHPVTMKPLEFSCPLPDDMKQFLISEQLTDLSLLRIDESSDMIIK